MKSVFDIFEGVRGKKAVFTFGRFNPPTKGHELLVNKVLNYARAEGATPFIFVSHSQDSKKNPLSFSDKVKYIELGIDGAKGLVQKDPSVRTPFDAVEKLGRAGFTDVIMVVGSDRVAEFQTTISKYIGHPDPNKRLSIERFYVVSAGERDPDSDTLSGLSASKMRDAALRKDLSLFMLGAPSKLSARFGKEMFDKVRQELTEQVADSGSGLSYTREEMPQIQADYVDEFIDLLVSQGVKVVSQELSIDLLKPTQSEINTDKVDQKFDDLVAGNVASNFIPFITSNDYRIIDRHHQLFALKKWAPGMKVPAFVIDLDIHDLLDKAKWFSKTTYKDIDGNSIK